jgi:polysaccharide biosynthesis/export protein
MSFYRSLLVFLWLFSSFSPAQTPTFTPREPRYRIQPNDVVEVQFRYTPEYNFTGTVQPDGFIALQMAGAVKIAGRTLDEASAAIAKQAGTRLREPEVTVLLKDFVKPHFIVAGEVARPGTFELRGEVTVIHAIAMSGGFKESSKRSQVILVRRVDQDHAEVKLLDLKQLMSPGKIREDILIRPDDMLVVPQNRISRVEPYVRIGSMGLYGLAFAIR